MAMQDNSAAAGRAGEPGAGGAGSELPRLLPQFIIRSADPWIGESAVME